jgi:predicted ATP-binding protein involved in virulence
MKIDFLRVKNYRCFADFSIDFPDHYTDEDGIGKPINLHVLLAPNMAGKSAILNALRISLSTPLQKIKANIAYQNTLGISTNEHRVIGNNPFSEIAREVEIAVSATAERWTGKEWALTSYEWRKYKEDYSGRHTKTEQIQGNIINDANVVFNRVTEHQDGVLPLFLYVGTEYIHQPKPVMDSLNQNGSLKQGYWYCLDDKSMEDYVFVWFKKLHATLVEQDRSELAKEYYQDFAATTLNIFRYAVQTMLPDIEGIDWVLNPLKKRSAPWEYYELTFKIEGQGVRTYEMLSDGYRYLVLLLGELVTRATLLNKSAGTDVLNVVTGVILIDEFGIHLHPNLQEDALTRLTSLFPQVQFIVTTHSPLLINGLRKEQLHKLSDDAGAVNKAVNPEEDAIGLGADGILREMFDVDSTFDKETVQLNEEYKQLLRKKMDETATTEDLGKFAQIGKKLAQVRFDPTVEIGTDDPITELVKERLSHEAESNKLKGNVERFSVEDLSKKVNTIMDNIFKKD